MKRIRITGIVIVLLAVAATTLTWAEQSQSEEIIALSNTKISLSQAIDTALKTVPGKALSAELDNEEGDYVFVVEVVSNDQTFEISLDSQTGKVLESKLDLEDDDEHGDKDQRD